MTVAPDFFDTEPRNWRARLAVSVEVMRELSRYSDPQEMYAVFARRMAQLFPVSRQLSISRRGLRFPQYRVTRFNLWTDPVNPWKESHRLPVHEGGLLAELLYADQPRVIDDLDTRAGRPGERLPRGSAVAAGDPALRPGHGPEHGDPRARGRRRVPARSHRRPRAAQQPVRAGHADARAVAGGEGSLRRGRLRTALDRRHSEVAAAGTTPKVPGLDVAVHYQTAKRGRRRLLRLLPAARRPARRADRRRQRARRTGRGADGGGAQHRPHSSPSRLDGPANSSRT